MTGRFTKKVDKSHLTDHEKRHTMALSFLGVLLILTGIGLAVVIKEVNIGAVVTFLILMGGTWCIAFAWGYIGAVEDERSGN